jgi:VWFA-related protein
MEKQRTARCETEGNLMTSLKEMRFLSGILACAVCFGQVAQTTEDLPKRSDIVVQVKVVIAPTTVLDRSGNYVNGLTIDDFRLSDNGKPQKITSDVTFQPISLVVAVQCSSMLNDILPKIQKIGSMLDASVVGENGEAAVIAFDHRIRTLQDFTSDAGRIDAAMKTIKPGSSTAAQIDAVTTAVRMLAKRPDSHRRVLLLISEKRDKGSEGKLREALTAAEFANVAIYSIDISHLVAQLTGQQSPMPPDPIPATAQHVPAGAVQTPTTVDIQRNSGNFIPLFVEIFKATKSLFIDDSLDVFTRYTGGKQYSFVSQRSLEKAVVAVGEELHSQYLLSYTPDNLDEAGFHEIRVEVNRPRLEVRTRPGYWVAARP